LAFLDNHSRIIRKKRCLRVDLGKFHQHVYAQLLLTQIPKAQKDSQVISVFFCFWDLCTSKQTRKLMAKSTPVIEISVVVDVVAVVVVVVVVKEKVHVIR